MNKFDTLRLDIFLEFENNSITEDELDILLEEVMVEEFKNELFQYVIETKEDWENFLKKNHYDAKSRTLKINGRTVYIETRHSDKSSKSGRNDYIRKAVDKLGGEAAALSPVAKNNTDIRIASGKIPGIIVNLDKIYEMNERQINYAIQHEVGHVDDFSANRKLNRCSNFISKLKYSDVGKEYTSDLKKSKEIISSIDKGKSVSKSDIDFVIKFYDKMKGKVEHLKDSDDDFYDAYSDVIIASRSKSALHRAFSAHDNDDHEIRADLYAKIKDPSIDIANDNPRGKSHDTVVRATNVKELMDDKNVASKAKKYMK